MSASARVNWGSIGRWLPGLLISALAMALLLRFTDWRAVEAALAVMGIAWLPQALLLFLISNVLRAMAWRTLLQNRASLGRVFLTMNEGYLVNILFPFRLGELARVLLLGQTAHLSEFFVLSTIVVEHAYDLAIAAGMFMATLPMVLGLESAQPLAITVSLLIALGLIILFLVAQNRGAIKSLLERAAKRNRFFQDKILPRLDAMFDGLGVLTNPGQFILSLSLMLACWLFGAAELYLILISTGVQAPFWWIGFLMGAVSFSIALPSAPAGIGVYEAAMVGALTILGVPSGQAFAFTIAAHLIHISVTGSIGAYGLFRDGETLSGLYRRLRFFQVR